jgi:aryl-alcohol dehydrogenase (NADP+)
MTFGTESTEEVSHAQLDLFVERGGNFVDTADVYSRVLAPRAGAGRRRGDVTC